MARCPYCKQEFVTHNTIEEEETDPSGIYKLFICPNGNCKMIIGSDYFLASD
jgi:hypothetical protein